jgi:hypothetical protein
VASITDKQWHQSGTTHVVAPVAVVRGSRSSCSSVMGGTTALRGPIAAPALDAQFTR